MSRRNKSTAAPFPEDEDGFVPKGENTSLYDMGIVEMRDKFPQSMRVSIQRLNDEKEWETLGSVPTDIIDEDYLQREFGPGHYALYFRDKGGRLVSGEKTTIRIGAPARSTQQQQSTSAAAPAPAPMVPHADSLSQIDLLKAELERRDQMLLRMIDAIATRQTAPAAAGSTVTELVAALGALKKLEPPAPMVSFPERLMERAFTMATRQVRDDGGSGEGSSELFSFLRDVWKEVKPQLGVTPAPAVPVAGAAAPEDEEEHTVDLGEAISSLKDHCRRGRPAEFIADMIADQTENNDELKAVLVDLIDRPLDEVLSLDEELKTPAYATWFGHLYTRLRVRLLGSQADPQRASGD